MLKISNVAIYVLLLSNPSSSFFLNSCSEGKLNFIKLVNFDQSKLFFALLMQKTSHSA